MRSHNAQVAVLLYTLVTGVALALGFMRGNPDLFHHPEPLISLPLWLGVPVGLLSGAGVGLGVVWVTQRAVTKWKYPRAIRLHAGLRQILGVADTPLHHRDILVLAASSAIAEELLFRGWLLPLAGIVISSLLFGVLHYAPRTSGMWVWVPLAILMGLAFGGLFWGIGNLAAPIVAHWVINFKNLHFINAYDPDAVSPDHDLLPKQKI